LSQAINQLHHKLDKEKEMMRCRICNVILREDDPFQMANQCCNNDACVARIPSSTIHVKTEEPAYLRRLRKEMEDLATKCDKLNTFLDRDDAESIVGMAEFSLMENQAVAMNTYLIMLNKRMGMKR